MILYLKNGLFFSKNQLIWWIGIQKTNIDKVETNTALYAFKSSTMIQSETKKKDASFALSNSIEFV